jgi:hypothetical protein
MFRRRRPLATLRRKLRLPCQKRKDQLQAVLALHPPGVFYALGCVTRVTQKLVLLATGRILASARIFVRTATIRRHRKALANVAMLQTGIEQRHALA